MWGASRWDRRKRPRNRGYYLEVEATPVPGHAEGPAPNHYCEEDNDLDERRLNLVSSAPVS